ncbi:MAG: DNA-directed RNA polymerase subunit beta', partial [Egibacteraceae bacterium]
GRPVLGPMNRPLKSLADMLKGKQGRFRQNLLGKRVDYSGRSVIVVGPELKLHQCGLPKQMALELFKPFVMKRLVDLNFAQNIKSAKRMVERARPQVWDVLEEVIRDHPVLLNRAPTLHRLGIQAFDPRLVDGKAIQIHPLVCAAFNADFDGDQMAVHLPLSSEAQAEARILMLSSNNILSPAHGRPIATPTQDMVLGTYYLTFALGAGSDGAKPPEGLVEAVRSGEQRIPSLSGAAEVVMALDGKDVGLQDWILVKLRDRAVYLEDVLAEVDAEEVVEGVVTSAKGVRVLTTPGRVLFNEILPPELPFENRLVGKKELADLVNRCADNYSRALTARVLDDMKDIGFEYATRAGVTVSIADVDAPPEKATILAEHDKRAHKVEQQFRKGVITDDERKQELVEIWTEATTRVAHAMEQNFDQLNPLYMMANSGARGNMTQIRQIAGMRGLVSNPRGEIIERPIKSNYREGLSVLEYFISTHGARKGLADTALRTADSGYLTRRLVDIAQDLIIREDDCGTERGLPITVGVSDSQALYGRTLSDTVHWPGSRKQLLKAGTEVTDAEVRLLRAVLVRGVDPDTGKKLKAKPTDSDRVVRVRTVLNCDARQGVCATCYGRALAEGQKVQIGESVGIIAAQSIGEPGTQLTMRTFHTGGVAGEDITHGLPRVVELFEARTPKGKAEIAHQSGALSLEETEKGLVITVGSGGDDEPWSVTVSRRARLRVEDGQSVRVGDQLTEGSIDPHEMLEVLGARETQRLLVREVQDVYRSQGVSIHDKHIELIVRQMLRRVNIISPGDTGFLPGELVDRQRFTEENLRIVDDGGEPANGRQILMGITKASLATESWLSAASFQETTRVLTEAAIEGKRDSLIGLKENVIIGKLIPAGTGMRQYRGVRPLPTEMPEQILPDELLQQFSDGGYGYETDEGWTMGEGG